MPPISSSVDSMYLPTHQIPLDSWARIGSRGLCTRRYRHTPSGNWNFYRLGRQLACWLCNLKPGKQARLEGACFKRVMCLGTCSLFVSVIVSFSSQSPGLIPVSDLFATNPSNIPDDILAKAFPAGWRICNPQTSTMITSVSI